ncbi:Coenzyme A disulfide reductase [Tetrabaena socialis]|uniref:Coenzyme A disulfide reductase n=1 Tax=Tetrabaena socialis TaxID=47790 RepID=A0A2J7ZK80_9CHLO|nr:Coenzyme A disulfide reductase [Tetrabaena socialis]|eukprot:PNH00673.1 Coenzyme A disulfide reductase [Tetrabaena socialis]
MAAAPAGAAKRVLIVGGVAGGASCAARLRRLDERAEITMFERGPYVSFANCGLPYYVGEVIKEQSSLLVANAAKFDRWFNVVVKENTEAELCYAPQYGSAKDPINLAGMVAANVLRGLHPLACWDELDLAALAEDPGAVLVDVREGWASRGDGTGGHSSGRRTGSTGGSRSSSTSGQAQPAN